MHWLWNNALGGRGSTLLQENQHESRKKDRGSIKLHTSRALKSLQVTTTSKFTTSHTHKQCPVIFHAAVSLFLLHAQCGRCSSSRCHPTSWCPSLPRTHQHSFTRQRIFSDHTPPSIYPQHFTNTQAASPGTWLHTSPLLSILPGPRISPSSNTTRMLLAVPLNQANN